MKCSDFRGFPNTKVACRSITNMKIERMEKNLNLICYRYYDELKKARVINCPQGIEYLEVTQEDFLFPVKEISETIEVRSKTVEVGERYKLSIVGQYKDGCNALSTSVNSTADSETITFSHADSIKSDPGEIYWSRTFIDCD